MGRGTQIKPEELLSPQSPQWVRYGPMNTAAMVTGMRALLGSAAQTSSSQAALATAQCLIFTVAEVSTWLLVAPFPRDSSRLPGSRWLTLALSHHARAMIHPPGIDAFWTEMWLGFLDCNSSAPRLTDSQNALSAIMVLHAAWQ